MSLSRPGLHACTGLLVCYFHGIITGFYSFQGDIRFHPPISLSLLPIHLPTLLHFCSIALKPLNCRVILGNLIHPKYKDKYR